MIIQNLGVLVVSLYLISTISYIVYFITQRSVWKRISPSILSFGIITHFVYLFSLHNALGRLPLGTVYEFVTSATFLFAVLYLILEFYIKDNSMGVIIAPIILVLEIFSLSGIDTSKTLDPQLTGLSFQVHVIFMLLAYSGFTLAFITSVMHLMLAREIHQKRLGFFFSRLPSLELFDRLNSSAATLGFAFATIGMLLGSFMGFKLWGNPFPLDVKFISFLLAWCIYFFHLYARLKLGWRGERAAWLSIIGFTVVLLTFLVVSLYFTEMHSYH